MADFIGAIDQGTTSTRFLVFDRGGRIVASAQKEHQQIYPQPGWVEHDPDEIWFRTREVIGQAMAQRGLKPTDLAAIGITNQRETTVLWDRHTGKPVANALVWQDMRVAESVSTTLTYAVLGLFSAASRDLATQLAPSVILGLPVGMFLLRRLEPEAFRRICMGANACFIAYGLARSLLEMNLAPAVLAYGLTVVVAAGQLFLVVRFIALRRRDALAPAPRAT